MRLPPSEKFVIASNLDPDGPGHRYAQRAEAIASADPQRALSLGKLAVKASPVWVPWYASLECQLGQAFG